MIDRTIAYLVKADEDQKIEELVGQLLLLQTSLGQERVDQFFKYIEQWDKFEDKREAWKIAVDDVSIQQSSDKILNLMIDREVTDGVHQSFWNFKN